MSVRSVLDDCQVNLVRVRQLVPQLSYSQLVLDGVIPEIGKSTPTLPSKRYPKWVYDLSKTNEEIFSDLGLFMEEILWELISGNRNSWPDIWTRVCRSPPPPQLATSGKYFGPILAHYQKIFNGFSCYHNHELKHGTVAGHPDFFLPGTPTSGVPGGWILEVKTTTGFAKMAEESYLQILAYSALARANGFANNFVGLVLPIQRELIWYNLTGWDHQKFLQVLFQEAEWVKGDLEMLTPQYFYESIGEDQQVLVAPTLLGTIGRKLVSSHCGAHMSKEVVPSRSQTSNGRSIQLFIGNPHAKNWIDFHDMQRLAQEVNRETPLYVHASYLINLAQLNPDGWDLARMCQELQGGQIISSKGVVVHVGKYKELNPHIAIQNMIAQIKYALNSATPTCPLLLETSAGEGTELGASLESLMGIYEAFGQDPRFKITVDSAHVHGLGYDPAWYLHQWVTRWPGSVALVHFNDSKKCRGSRVDEHWFPGLGHIGYKRMKRLHDLCVEHGIPMVRE